MRISRLGRFFITALKLAPKELGGVKLMKALAFILCSFLYVQTATAEPRDTPTTQPKRNGYICPEEPCWEPTNDGPIFAQFDYVAGTSGGGGIERGDTITITGRKGVENWITACRGAACSDLFNQYATRQQQESAFVAFGFSYDDAAALAQNRAVGACAAERDALNETRSFLNSPVVTSGQSQPPGYVIMNDAELNDPMFTGGAWAKYEAYTIHRDGSNQIRSVVIIHYMFNSVTKQSGQLKLKNTIEEGCGNSNAA